VGNIRHIGLIGQVIRHCSERFLIINGDFGDSGHFLTTQGLLVLEY
jgi:hypothetical protein